MKVAQLCPTLSNPTDYTVHGILQARILEWGRLSFSKGSSHPRDRTQVSGIAGGFFTSWATREAQMKGLGSKHNRGCLRPEVIGALGLDFILEAETKPFWLMQEFDTYFGYWYFEYSGTMMENVIIYVEKINGIDQIIRIIGEAIHTNG